METGRRTIIKALLWNLLGVMMMALTGYAMTGSLALGGSLALANTAIGLVTYILYERLWARIGWGRDRASGHVGGPRHG